MSEALNAKDIGAFLTVLDQACTKMVADESRCGDMNRSLVKSHRFQAARYDGTLQGTEVGMVLFYTDLLMKLWAQDYERATPRAVTGFPNRTAIEVAAIYRTEVRDAPTTRLWLGSLSDGYQTASGGSEMLFARIATRVFAVPNDAITGEDRKDTTEPHIYNRIFMTWWNDHYEEVARYEPEYERLNEIMKWSQLISWLNTSDQPQVARLSRPGDGESHQPIHGMESNSIASSHSATGRLSRSNRPVTKGRRLRRSLSCSRARSKALVKRKAGPEE